MGRKKSATVEPMINKSRSKSLDVVASIKCSACGALHSVEADSSNYVVFYGDVAIGTGQPVVSGNLDVKGKLVKSTVLCRNDKCLGEIIKALMP